MFYSLSLVLSAYILVFWVTLQVAWSAKRVLLSVSEGLGLTLVSPELVPDIRTNSPLTHHPLWPLGPLPSLPLRSEH